MKYLSEVKVGLRRADRSLLCSELKSKTGVSKNTLRRLAKHEPRIVLMQGPKRLHVAWNWKLV